MTLQEFVIDTFAANMIEFDDAKVKSMEDEITKYARKKAAGQQSIEISDDEIRQFILNSKELLEKLEKEAKERRERKIEETLKAKEKKERKASEEDQMYQLF